MKKLTDKQQAWIAIGVFFLIVAVLVTQCSEPKYYGECFGMKVGSVFTYTPDKERGLYGVVESINYRSKTIQYGLYDLETKQKTTSIKYIYCEDEQIAVITQ